jgi:hypothetical protein
MVSHDGYWFPMDDDDKSFLGALGLPTPLDPGVVLEDQLCGRWIEGRPGPPDPDGFNPLEEVKATGPMATVVSRPASQTSSVTSMSTYPVYRSNQREGSECVDLLSELRHLPDRIVEKIQPLVNSGKSPSTRVDGPSDRPPRAAELAYRSYKIAEHNVGTGITDQMAYAWLRENGHPDYDLPSFDTWARYLRIARPHYDDQKNQSRRGRSGRSTVRQSEI